MEVEHTSPRAKTIPVIDLSDPDEELVVRAVAKAGEEWGAFQVVNHGIPAELLRRLQEVGRQFFELPVTDKEAVAKLPGLKNVQGYDSKSGANLKAWNDHLLHYIWPQSCINYRFWPKNPPAYRLMKLWFINFAIRLFRCIMEFLREVNEEYARNVKKLSETIMGYLSKGLGLGHEALNEGLGGGEYMIRINYYPPSDSVEGAPAHTDSCGLALLVSNEVPGLQVFKDNHWFDVECIDSAVIVLIGDQIMRMSNGRYKNVLHRSTMDKENIRMTWPVLIDPKRGVVVGPLPELTGDDNPPKFESLTFVDYIYHKFSLSPHDG